MKISKPLIITFCVVFFFLITIVIYSNVKHNKLKKEITQLETNYILLKEKISNDNSLVSIDSLLVNGEYETALSAYEKQFSDSIKDDDKDYVQFRINIAKQFMNLEGKTVKEKEEMNIVANKKISNKQDDSTKTAINYDSLYSVLEKTKKQLYSAKKQLKRKSVVGYLTFKNSKKHTLHYVGHVNKDKASGYGIAIFDTGGRYEGEWTNNKREGKGVFYWEDGEHYEGDYKNDLRDGKGTYFWTNGKKYVGGWKNDEREGEGVFYNKKGKILAKGVWENDKLVNPIN